MVERTQVQAGFTLVEMMVALGILVMGLTSLIGLFTAAVSTRYSAELRSRAAAVAEEVLRDIQENVLARDDGQEAEIPSLGPQPVEGMPAMRYSVDFIIDPQQPDLVMAEVRIGWREQGAELEQVFRRILPREQPFRERVLRLRSSR